MCPRCKTHRSIIVKKGSYLSKYGRKIQRYFCKSCRRSFSDQTLHPSYRLRKYHRRNQIFRLLGSGVSQRQTAKLLHLSRHTIDRYVPVLAALARSKNEFRTKRSKAKVVVFDEMETFEHTKCKPVSIALAVEDKLGAILSIETAEMPANGRLAEISRKKYGIRNDERPQAIRKMLMKLKCNKCLEVVKSDMCPRYPKAVREILPHVSHSPSKGRKPQPYGLGELKVGGWDPLFYLNHTAARIRDLTKRLSRRTWCTTKLIERLQMILEIFQYYRNQELRGKDRPVI